MVERHLVLSAVGQLLATELGIKLRLIHANKVLILRDLSIILAS